MRPSYARGHEAVACVLHSYDHTSPLAPISPVQTMDCPRCDETIYRYLKKFYPATFGPCHPRQ
jgi:hypothetical protein